MRSRGIAARSPVASSSSTSPWGEEVRPLVRGRRGTSARRLDPGRHRPHLRRGNVRSAAHPAGGAPAPSAELVEDRHVRVVGVLVSSNGRHALTTRHRRAAEAVPERAWGSGASTAPRASPHAVAVGVSRPRSRQRDCPSRVPDTALTRSWRYGRWPEAASGPACGSPAQPAPAATSPRNGAPASRNDAVKLGSVAVRLAASATLIRQQHSSDRLARSNYGYARRIRTVVAKRLPVQWIRRSRICDGQQFGSVRAYFGSRSIRSRPAVRSAKTASLRREKAIV